MLKQLKVIHAIGALNNWGVHKRADILINIMRDTVNGTLFSYRDITVNDLKKVDFVHVHGLQMLPLIMKPLVESGTPWGFEVISHRSLKSLSRCESILKKASVCWCKNKQLIDIIKPYLSINPVYIPNGVNATVFKPSAIRIGWAGNGCNDAHLNYKGVPLIKEAIKQLNNNGGDYKFFIGGEYPKVWDHKKMVAFYQSLDIFVNASEGEGCSNVTNEALSCGIPVVSTDVGIIRELAKLSEQIIIVPRTAEGIRQGIESLIPQRFKISKAMEKYSWSGEEIMGVYLDTYREAIGI